MFTHVSDDRKRIGFSVARFNILAKVLAQSDHFPGVKKERLQWSNRKQVLMKKNKKPSPDATIQWKRENTKQKS